MPLPEAPAERHAAVADGFGRLVAHTTDWSAPAPVDGWTARDVVAHLVEWFPHFLAAGGVELAPGPSASDDPVAAWRHHASAVQALVEQRGEETFSHPHAGTDRLADVVDRFYTSDVFMHAWDLALATGQEPGLDAVHATRLLEGMRPIEQLLRDSGHYGPAVPVADDAPAADRLMAFVGRDPAWRPPA
ncbi:maleylpyruvate isomerase N-terminal domain-containing protein [Nocardioides sp. zg-1228]|uniref:maleylpyruvate isomerase N-terminal domain-containing protein n=1 Tax=Nocardioides sp. zg-1228 TaxID=2763008 RepID=UPI001642BB1C|nr:maleylpyruvate isomerase N-terminal domain-containing protein [Nocardioides sp. zg-1228]MBC2934841.1 maleylpyruvate isomerase N-terminal domain-containing protein [Nocardioides sp. zg-1228]QSF58369.1 maleylpyruvate isomerase N-terminal domain-containing protein [Nocardioides sp. zg-1228]